MNPYTKATFDFASLPPLTSPRRRLELRSVALGLIHLEADRGYTFTHRHREQEEVYIVVEGSGELLVNGESVPLARGDFVRVSPQAWRALKAGAEGLLAICAGAVGSHYPEDENARYLIDDGEPNYDDLPPWCAGDLEVERRNRELKQRMLRAQARRLERGREPGEE